jgi:hypothetical protein
MRAIGRTGLCLLALLTCGAMAATSASAAEYEVEGIPEFGRCVPAAGKSGVYKGAKCLTLASPAGTGNYDWLPGPGEKNKFEGTISTTTLETVGKFKVQCSVGVASGEYKTPKTATVTLELVGCLNLPSLKKCQSTPAKEAEIETTVEAELGFIKGGSKPKVGLDLKPSSPIAFSCGTGVEVPTPVSVEGSAIGIIKPPDNMLTTLKLGYIASGGKQVPEKFEGGVKDTLSLTRVTGLETFTEQAGLTIIGIEEKPKPLVIENEEPIEVKAK